jgi:hypothetical protein
MALAAASATGVKSISLLESMVIEYIPFINIV